MTSSASPVSVIGLSGNVVSVSAGEYLTCAIMSTSGVQCWGGVGTDQLGIAGSVFSTTPVSVTGLDSGVEFISVGIYHSCALMSTGGVQCWGENLYGQLGNGSTTKMPTPSSVLGVNGAGALNLLTPQPPTIDLASGWNLVGNSVNAPLAVASLFNDAIKVTTIWKWVTTGSAPGVTYPAWAFYSPAQADGGAAYATSKGYELLSTIGAGEGFWVNATQGFSVALPAGTSVQTSAFKTMPSGWNLVATGETQTASQFNAQIGATVPGTGVVPINLTSLWAWDTALGNWYFYAPVQEANGTLASYVAGKNYLDFTAQSKKLGTGVGFWVNKP
jgi:hypothetical protein